MKKSFTIAFITSILICNMACKKFVEIDAPSNTVHAENVYASDLTAAAVLTGVYTNWSLDNDAMRNYRSGLPLMSLYPGLSADELTLYEGSTNQELINYYQNDVKPNILSNTDFWARIYKYVFVANSAIDGLTKSVSLSPAVKTQLLAEAYFIRAFCYFHLINLYGDAPLILGTNYAQTSQQKRNSKQDVYRQIIEDLKIAEANLNENYVSAGITSTTDERTRPNKSAAIALLSRCYLYTGDWVNAETSASRLIGNDSRFQLLPLNEVFLKNSKETIWSLQPVRNDVNSNTGDGKLFVLQDYGPSDQYQVYLSDNQVKSFETGDQRLTNWINSVEIDGIKYYYSYKYKVGETFAENSEYSIVFRLAEQYLIRAEARIQLNQIASGIADLNSLRSRAIDLDAPQVEQLKLLSATLSKQDALTAVLHERQVELFTEWGHRWLDLKRMAKINLVMPDVTAKKGGTWNSTDSLYPIPLIEIQSNSLLKQNQGY